MIEPTLENHETNVPNETKVDRISPQNVWLQKSRNKIDEIMDSNRRSLDPLESQILTRERYTPEFVNNIVLGLAELAEIYGESSEELKTFIFETPVVTLTYSGMLPEANLFQSIHENATPEVLAELKHRSQGRNTRLYTIENIPVLLNEAALILLRKTYPEYMNIPSEIDDKQLIDHICENSKEYLKGIASSQNKESFNREIRYGLISGFELESCKIFASESVYGFLHPKNPSTPTIIKGLLKPFESLLTEDPEVETLLGKLKDEIPRLPEKEDELDHLSRNIGINRVGMGFRRFTEEASYYPYDWYQVVKIFRQLVTDGAENVE